MSWLLFMDESGHDHKNMPAEVRGGVALHAGKVWPFLKAWHDAEVEIFGVRLTDYGKEIKGHKLLDKDRLKWAAQGPEITDAQRHHGVRRFLTLSQEKKPPSRADFTAYGQACAAMARRIFTLLRQHDARIFASVIPKGVRRPDGYAFDHFLRKDHVFLLERYHAFLERERQSGLLVMDRTDDTDDRRFVRRLHDYFTKTQTGRERAGWIVPSPLFVASDMVVGVQAADLVLYCINWGYRPQSWTTLTAERKEIGMMTSDDLFALQFRDEVAVGAEARARYGIFLMPDPYATRNKEGGKADAATL